MADIITSDLSYKQDAYLPLDGCTRASAQHLRCDWQVLQLGDRLRCGHAPGEAAAAALSTAVPHPPARIGKRPVSQAHLDISL